MAAERELSKELETALAAEWRSLTQRIEDQRERADRLRALADQVQEQAHRDELLLAELEGLVGLAPELRLETLNQELRGRRLQEVAIEILRSDVDLGRPGPLPRLVRATSPAWPPSSRSGPSG